MGWGAGVAGGDQVGGEGGKVDLPNGGSGEGGGGEGREV